MKFLFTLTVFLLPITPLMANPNCIHVIGFEKQNWQADKSYTYSQPGVYPLFEKTDKDWIRATEKCTSNGWMYYNGKSSDEF